MNQATPMILEQSVHRDVTVVGHVPVPFYFLEAALPDKLLVTEGMA